MKVTYGQEFSYEVDAVIDTGATTSCIYVSNGQLDTISSTNPISIEPVGLSCHKVLQAVSMKETVFHVHLYCRNTGVESASVKIRRLLITSSIGDKSLSIVGLDILSQLHVTMSNGTINIQPQPQPPGDIYRNYDSRILAADTHSNRFTVRG